LQGVPEKEIETYTLVSSALKHPIKRKILRIFTEKPLSFTEMQDVLKINNAHISNHLHAMKEMLNQTEGGKYFLSTFMDVRCYGHGVRHILQVRTTK